jgi:hypothetical protein
MQHTSMIILLTLALGGCVQPSAEKEMPVPRGAYLVIDGSEAWAVLVDGSKRREEHGKVLEKVLLVDGSRKASAGYLIEMPNCGELQWFPQHLSNGESGHGARIFLPATNTQIDASECILGQVRNEAWTALDYSG